MRIEQEKGENYSRILKNGYVVFPTTEEVSKSNRTAEREESGCQLAGVII